MSAQHAIYPGTFDPVTRGHLDILTRALALFDRVTVAVAESGDKNLFTLQERVDLFASAVKGWAGCEVVGFSGLLVEEMQARQAPVVVRGIRSLADYEHEWAMAGINRTLYPEGESVFLLAKPHLAAVSSTLVRDVALHGGDLDQLVVPEVARALAGKLPGK